MMSARNFSTSSSRYPFTQSQWQELEQQALIYKYMVTGIPIPSDLILPLRRSFFLDSTMTSPSLAFPPQPSMSWGCFQLGFGRKPEDPEPGRCRRTDGKKWRCSKEAYPDSKYCERHMHRGKNRSRKPVEMSLATNPTTTTPNNNNIPPLPLSISTPETRYTHHQQQQHFMYPPYSSSSKQQHNSSSSYFNFDNNTTTSNPFSSTDRDFNRYYHGMKDVDGYSFLSESERGSSCQFRPLGLSSFGEKEQHGVSAMQQNTYSFSRDESEEKQQHCFVLGADFKLDRPVKHDDQKPLRPFFDEWPQRSKDSWMNSDGDHSSLDSYSKTQLSISVPVAHHDFPIISSRYNID